MEQFYKEIYGGTALEGAQLTEFLARAEDQLRLFEQVYTVTELVPNGRRMAVCAMAEALAYFDAAQNGTGGLRYASVGTVSVSGKGIYQSLDISPAAQTRELYRCAGTYLSIYRGMK